MATTQNTFTGDGSNLGPFSFTFKWLESTDIKVTVAGVLKTAGTHYNLQSLNYSTKTGGQVLFTAGNAPANGAAIVIYRQTDDTDLAATFYSGSAIRAQDLNNNFVQGLYVTQESSNNATTAIGTANTALTNANTAISTANGAVTTANTASSNASAAVATANTASSNASAAVSTANTASSNATTAVNTANSAASNASTALSTANTALSTANTASSNASTALSTANTASTNASAAVSTANTASSNASSAVSTANTASSNASTALSTANTAISTANAAASAVANAILYDIVANVAAIPASPANNDAVEVTDSTGIQSFTPLTGRPAGFVGNSGLSVRLVYTTTGSTWNWIQYFPNDPETRYLKFSGGTLTGALTLAADPTTNLQAATKQYVDNNLPPGTTVSDTAPVSPGVGDLWYDSTGGRLYVWYNDGNTSQWVDASPQGNRTSTFQAGTAALPGLTPEGDTNTGIYSPGADQVAISTGGSRRLNIDSSGNLTIDTGDAYIYGVRAGRGGSARADNTAFGKNALNANTTGDYSVAIGSGALQLNQGGISNVAVGLSALSASVSANYNTAVGTEALRNNTGSSNTCIGNIAGRDLTNGSNNTIIGEIAGTAGLSNTVIIGAGSTERLRIDSSGRVGVGTTSPSDLLDVSQASSTAYATTDQTNAFIQISNPSNASANIYGGIKFRIGGGVIGGGAGSACVYGLRENGAGNAPGTALTFGTTNSSNVYGERVRIDASGRLLVGTSTNNLTSEYALFGRSFNPNSNSTAFADQQTPLSVYGNFGNGSNDQACSSALTVYGWSSQASNTGVIMRGWWSQNGPNLGTPTLRYQINSNGNVTNSNNSYGALSDVRYKQDIIEAGSQWDDIKNIEIKKFRFIDDVQNQTEENPAPYLLGCIAQQVAEVSPGLVELRGDDKDQNGDTVPSVLTMKYSVLYMKAVKALQEAQHRIETLEAQNASFEARLTALEGGTN